jgi:hypothetical protein
VPTGTRDTLRVAMLYRVLSVVTWLGNLGFLVLFISAFFRIFLLADDSEDNVVELLLTTSLIFIAIGLIAMIAHLNLSREPTDDEKATWRGRLWFGGSFTAARYLWLVAGRPSKEGLNSSTTATRETRDEPRRLR